MKKNRLQRGILRAASAHVAWHAKKGQKNVPTNAAIVLHVFSFAAVATQFSAVVMMVPRLFSNRYVMHERSIFDFLIGCKDRILMMTNGFVRQLCVCTTICELQT